MLDILHDSSWQLAGVLISALAGIITVLIPWIQWIKRERKEISYKVVSDSLIGGIEETIGHRVQILFNGQAVQNIRLVVLKIWNSGNSPIKSEDYFSPIRISFENGKILEDKIVDADSGNIPDKILVLEKPNVLLLEPSLWKPKDSVTIRILLTGPLSKILVEGRIVAARITEAK